MQVILIGFTNFGSASTTTTIEMIPPRQDPASSYQPAPPAYIPQETPEHY